MKDSIKKGIIIGFSALLTMIIGGLAYAAVSNTITSGTPLTATMWNEMAGNYDYSTSEVNTGKKWIDGKTIYRKVVNFGALPNNTTKVISHGITFDSIISIGGYAQNPLGPYVLPIPYVHINDTINDISIFINNNDIVIVTSIDKSDYTETHVVLEYTK